MVNVAFFDQHGFARLALVILVVAVVCAEPNDGFVPAVLGVRDQIPRSLAFTWGGHAVRWGMAAHHIKLPTPAVTENTGPRPLERAGWTEDQRRTFATIRDPHEFRQPTRGTPSGGSEYTPVSRPPHVTDMPLK